MNHYINIDKEFFLDLSQIAYASKDESGNLVMILKNSSSALTVSMAQENTEQVINSVALWNQSITTRNINT